MIQSAKSTTPSLDDQRQTRGPRFWLGSLAAALITASGLMVVVWYLDRSATSVYQEQVRGNVVRDLAAIRGAAEIAINRRIHLLIGLRAHVAVNPEMTESEFAQLASLIIQEVDGIRSVTSIKDNVINDVFPREGNEGALGLRLLEHPDQRAAAEYAIETRKPWLVGPVKLVQGGEAFIHRAPVFTLSPGSVAPGLASPGSASPGSVAANSVVPSVDSGKDANDHMSGYWGMVSLLIDKETLVSEIQQHVPPGLKIAIRGRDGRGRSGGVFLGDERIAGEDSIATTISLPTGSWQLYGIPHAGWPTAAPSATSMRLGGAASAMLVATLVFLLVRANQRYRDSAGRLKIASQQADSARRVAEFANKRLVEEALEIKRYARELEQAKSEAERMMKDIEAARVKLANSNSALERSNQELEQFAYVASHDLQEPLRKVSSFCELLQSDCGDKIDAQGQQYIRFIVEGTGRMRTLIQDLLSYSRIESQGLELKTVDATQALQDAKRNLQAIIEESGAVITHDDLPLVKADERQLTQLFEHLIGNAIKYRGKEIPTIHIGAEHEGATWIISVADNGIGIEPRCHEKVFGVFKRLHSRDEYAGTGIGLAICRRIVDRQGGQIWVESEPGQGSTFRFTVGDGTIQRNPVIGQSKITNASPVTQPA